MDRSHDRTPAQAPPAPAVCAPLPARPNLGAADFPVEPSAAAHVLGADPLAGYFYPDLIEDPTRTVREALFGAYLYDYAGFEAMLGLTQRAARVELAASTDPTRAGQLAGLPARIAAGKAALAADPEPFELDVLLGADPGRVVGLLTGLFTDHAHNLAERLRERAAGDPELTRRAERLLALVQGTEAGSLWQGGLDLTASGADALIDAGTEATADVPLLGPLLGSFGPTCKANAGIAVGALRAAGDLAGGLLEHLRRPLDAAAGLGKMASNLPLGPIPQLRRLVDVLKGERSVGDAFFGNPLAALGEDLSRDAAFWGEVVRGVAAPYKTSIDEGQYDEAIGRGLFDLGAMFFGAGEGGAVGKGASLAAKLPKGGGLTKLAAVEEAGLARVGAKGFKEAASGTKEPLRVGAGKPAKGALPTKPRALNPAVQAAFHAAMGETATQKLLVRFGADALEHYGVAFFQQLKGVTDATMEHLLQPGRISKGEITGCHDEGTFLRVLVEDGNGAVVSRIPAPYPGVVKYEYNLFKRDKTGAVGQPPTLQARQPLPKTVLTDLAANPEGWRVEFERILNIAIAERRIVPDKAEFSVSASGVSWKGVLRDGELKTLYPEI